MSNILTPLFEVASKLSMIEDLPFHFRADTFINHLGNRVHNVSWYVSKTTDSVEDCGLARFDLVSDIPIHMMYTDNIDEDEVNKWIDELMHHASDK